MSDLGDLDSIQGADSSSEQSTKSTENSSNVGESPFPDTSYYALLSGFEYPQELESLRRVLTPLSKDQLIELLAGACVDNQATLQNVLSVIYESRSHRRLYVKNLPFSVCTESVIKLFSQFGDVEEGIVLKRNGKSRGYAFVTYKTIESAQLACKESITVNGRVLMVKLAADPFPFEARRSDALRRKLFVRNLGFTTTEDSLSAVFGKYGELEESVILRTREGESRGYGFVTFVNTESTMKALQQPHHLVDGRLVFVHQAIEGRIRSSRNSNKIPNENKGKKGSKVADDSQNSCLGNSNSNSTSYTSSSRDIVDFESNSDEISNYSCARSSLGIMNEHVNSSGPTYFPNNSCGDMSKTSGSLFPLYNQHNKMKQTCNLRFFNSNTILNMGLHMNSSSYGNDVCSESWGNSVKFNDETISNCCLRSMKGKNLDGDQEGSFTFDNSPLFPKDSFYDIQSLSNNGNLGSNGFREVSGCPLDSPTFPESSYYNWQIKASNELNGYAESIKLDCSGFTWSKDKIPCCSSINPTWTNNLTNRHTISSSLTSSTGISEY
ncbi:RNA recognition motif. family protein [Cryptosporidium muris RN66]|uniref:RNA recognition motif. family protein n=1 Tax=Cryptosporidium muris (strain RN66) TaxID=441375 RepID=B6A9K0_CRYMR|nr:RNA recognition motif. family protein [Cryptosporidium muris RN66]EEA04891.1 RNA recognition motif. family protein [Cryptosporidium muris RN66]|eukprot:XP_002139240.1 RNA recognition motif. family protein [Cryptosporidium muris RN66]